MRLRRYFKLCGFCLIALLSQYGRAASEISISILGVDTAVAENIRAHIGTLPESERTRERQLRRRLERAVKHGSEALGYYQNHFEYRFEGDQLILNVSPGVAVLWEPPDIVVPEKGLSIAAIRNFVAAHPFTPNTRMTHSQYDNFKRELVRLADEYGFIEASYAKSRLSIDPAAARARAHLQLQLGERYRISDIEFVGSSLSPALLRKLSPLQVGDNFRRSKVIELQRNFQNSQYFAEIAIETDLQPPGSAKLTVSLRDTPRHHFGVGVGFGTDTGPRLRLDWHQPRLNRYGHRLTSDARISEPIRELSTNYRVPLDPPLARSFNAGASWTDKRVEDTVSQVARLSATVSNPLWEYWRYDFGTAYEWERYEQGDQPRETVGYLIPGISLSYLEMPSVTDPQHGRKLTLSLQGSAPALGADTQFLRGTAYYKQLVPLGGGHLLIARAQIGAIHTDTFSLVPASKRFFTGGDQTVRGFGFETLSPADDSGELTGGKFLNVASLEYSLKVTPQWRAAVFTDAGRSYIDSDAPWHQSAGFGVRWLSPLGQIRADLAFPVNDDKSGARLHIFMGPPL